MRKSWKKGMALALACALVVSSNGATEDVAKAAKKYVALNKTSVKLNEKQSVKLKVKTKVKGTKIKKTTFKSSNSKVATVTKKGVVTAKKAGSAKITVKVKFKKGKKAGSSTLTAKITVAGAKVSPSVAPTAGSSTKPVGTAGTQTNATSTPKATTASNASTGAVTTATPAGTATPNKTPGAGETEEPEETPDEDEPETSKRPTTSPSGTEEPDEDEPEETAEPDENQLNDEEGNYYKAGIYQCEYGDDGGISNEKLMYDWSYLVSNEMVTVSNNTVTASNFDKIDTDQSVELILDKSIKKIGKGAFKGCDNIDIVDSQMYNQAVTIGEQAFQDSAVQLILVYADVIEKEAFSGCKVMECSEYLFGNVKTIGEKAFSGCEKLEVIFLSDKITSVGKGAFDTEFMEIYLSTDHIPEGFADGWFVEEKGITVYSSEQDEAGNDIILSEDTTTEKEDDTTTEKEDDTDYIDF